MRDVYDYAKYFIKKGLDTNSNTYDANMKLQKLLVFANLINMAKYGEPLFENPIMAFRNGCVVEKVRLRYKHDYFNFIEDSEKFNPDFTEEEYETLTATISIFGDLSARELSELNHSFEFWREAYTHSEVSENYHDKHSSVISVENMRKELPKINTVLSSYYESKCQCMHEEKVNGITFYYDPKDISINDSVIDELYTFSSDAEDSAYTVYMDNGELVIY